MTTEQYLPPPMVVAATGLCQGDQSEGYTHMPLCNALQLLSLARLDFSRQRHP
jgi:hypothetical protein